MPLFANGLVNLDSGPVAEVISQSTTADAKVDQWAGNGGANQEWTAS